MKKENKQIAIELKGIHKTFGNVIANENVSLKIEEGTIHGIIGENGAGKSTLMSILYGFYKADKGKFLIKNKEIEIGDTHDAIQQGIGMVHQHFMLVEKFTVLENIMLSAHKSPWLYAAQKNAREQLMKLEKEYELSVEPDAKIEELPVGIQQRVEILKTLYRGADVLILDEPTGVLTPAEAKHLFRILEQLKKQGKTIILITHKLKEIMNITDNVSVMRKGKMVAHRKTNETNKQELAQLMVGRSVMLEINQEKIEKGEVKLEVNGLTVQDKQKVKKINNVSFQIHSGEIVGIAGVAGNGQSELIHAVGGLVPFDGEISIAGKKIVNGNGKHAELTRQWGLAHVPEDRHNEGLVLPFSAGENGILGIHNNQKFGNNIFLKTERINHNCKTNMEKYDIRPKNTKWKAANFSGGNQQKIVLAREMETDPELLIIGQPTRGVDVGAIEFIYKQIMEMKKRGKAILLVSVELDEIRTLADRILVMFNGRIVAERKPETSESELGLLMAGG